MQSEEFNFVSSYLVLVSDNVYSVKLSVVMNKVWSIYNSICNLSTADIHIRAAKIKCQEERDGVLRRFLHFNIQRRSHMSYRLYVPYLYTTQLTELGKN